VPTFHAVHHEARLVLRRGDPLAPELSFAHRALWLRLLNASGERGGNHRLHEHILFDIRTCLGISFGFAKLLELVDQVEPFKDIPIGRLVQLVQVLGSSPHPRERGAKNRPAGRGDVDAIPLGGHVEDR